MTECAHHKSPRNGGEKTLDLQHAIKSCRPTLLIKPIELRPRSQSYVSESSTAHIASQDAALSVARVLQRTCAGAKSPDGIGPNLATNEPEATCVPLSVESSELERAGVLRPTSPAFPNISQRCLWPEEELLTQSARAEVAQANLDQNAVA